MKFWILTDFRKEQVGNLFDKKIFDIAANLQKLPEGCEVVNIYDLVIEIDSQNKGKIWHSGQYVERPDMAFALYMGMVAGNESKYHLQVLDQLESLGTFLMTNSTQLMKTWDKLKCGQLLAKAGVNTPKTVLLNSRTPITMVVESLGLPMVVKPVDGSEGRGVCLVNTVEELQKMVDEKDEDTTLIAQKYISTSKGRDLRVILIGDEVVCAYVRDNTKSGDFRSNVCVGGVSHIVVPPEKAVTLARKARRALDLNMCGLDLLFEGDGFTIGEVNFLPGIEDWMMYEGELVKVRYHRMLMAYMKGKVQGKQ